MHFRTFNEHLRWQMTKQIAHIWRCLRRKSGEVGRFVDADALLQPITNVESVAADVGGVRLDGLLYQEKYGQALSLANALISGHPGDW